MITKSKILLFLLLSFIAGVFVRSFFEISNAHLFLLLILFLVILFVFYENKYAALAAFFVFAFVFGVWLVGNAIGKAENLTYVGKTLGEKAVVQKVSLSNFGQNIIAKLTNEKISILLAAPQYPEYQYGDLLEITCAAKAIENRDTDFDYRMYMAKEGVFYQCDKPNVNKIGENYGSHLYAKIIFARKNFEEKIIKVIPMPEGALASGLLFGGSGGLSKEIQNDFSQTGMTHIVAVSGYNVTIIVEYLIMLGIALGLWRKQAIWFAAAGIVLFVIMAGLPASAVRAGVMSGVLLWAMKNGRLASSENAIIFAAAVMLCFNPLLLRWDVGFQLSFLATLGIVLTSSFWEKSFVKKNKALGISEAIALSLSAQIFVLPIIAYNFHITSLVSLLANVFILPIIPLSMLLVFLVTLAGFIFGPLSSVFAWLAFLTLTYELKLIHVLAKFPYASVEIKNVSPWWTTCYYMLLLAIIWRIKNKQKRARIEFEENPLGSDILASRLNKGK